MASRGACSACGFAWRSRRHRPGSHRQMLGQSRGVRLAAVRRDRRSALGRGGVGRADRAGRRSAAGRRGVRLRVAADPAQRRRRPTFPAIRASPARTARSMRSRSPSASPAPGSASAVVTGPVAKEQLYAIGFQHPGQTEFVAERCGVSPGNVVMMLAGPTLRTVPVTTHLPLSEVAAHLTSALIESRGRAALRGLQRNFGIAEPRLAVSGPQPACRRRRPARPRRDRDHRAGDRRACRRRLARHRPASRPTRCSMRPPAPITTRRCACTTTRR